jgi:hypothetical protein
VTHTPQPCAASNGGSPAAFSATCEPIRSTGPPPPTKNICLPTRRGQRLHKIFTGLLALCSAIFSRKTPDPFQPNRFGPGVRVLVLWSSGALGLGERGRPRRPWRAKGQALDSTRSGERTPGGDDPLPPLRLPCGASARRSAAIELNQSLVADPEVMRDLVEHDVSDLAA